jgi:hypothetical protein
MDQARDRLRREELAWWLHPLAIFVGLNGLTCVAAWVADPETYLKLWRTPKYFNDFSLLLAAAVIVAFSVGLWLALANHDAKLEWPGTVSFSQALVLFKVSFWISVMAYGVWISLGISRGLGWSALKSVFAGGSLNAFSLKPFLQTVPGITTCTQFGIAAVVLGCLIGGAAGWKIVWRKLAILFLLALLRALLYSERLAFLELAIPFLVAWMAEPAPWTRSRRIRTLIRIAPVLAAGAIYLVFTGFEYVRSWSIYYSSRESSLFLFTFWRLLGYYVTSLNNSAFLLSSLHHSLGGPYFSFNFLWQFPVLNAFVKDTFSWVHMDYASYMALLGAGANPEFNNWGGLLTPIVDFGVAVGLEYWVVMGLITGYLYKSYLCKHPLGLCLYPVVYLALTEVPRYLYWGEGRAFPALAFLLLSGFLLVRSASNYQSSELCELNAH